LPEQHVALAGAGAPIDQYDVTRERRLTQRRNIGTLDQPSTDQGGLARRPVLLVSGCNRSCEARLRPTVAPVAAGFELPPDFARRKEPVRVLPQDIDERGNRSVRLAVEQDLGFQGDQALERLLANRLDTDAAEPVPRDLGRRTAEVGGQFLEVRAPRSLGQEVAVEVAGIARAGSAIGQLLEHRRGVRRGKDAAGDGVGERIGKGTQDARVAERRPRPAPFAGDLALDLVVVHSIRKTDPELEPLGLSGRRLEPDSLGAISQHVEDAMRGPAVLEATAELI
jgi:hypothetical protein